MAFKNRELVTRPLFPIGVNVFVVRDGKLLLGKRKSEYHDGEWGVPGGHLEEGELMVDCARRELEEETGLHAEHFTFVNVDNEPRVDGWHYVHFGFIAEGVTGELELREPDKCYEWGWFTLDELPEPIFIGHRHTIKGFIEKRAFTE